jgi:ATP-dependent protease Clp ATPase subunit
MSVKPTESGEPPRCSFCHKSKDDVAYLVASPPDYPRVYICDECVEVCHSILGESRSEPQAARLPKRGLRRLPSHIIKCPKCGEAFGEIAGKKPLSTS